MQADLCALAAHNECKLEEVRHFLQWALHFFLNEFALHVWHWVLKQLEQATLGAHTYFKLDLVVKCLRDLEML
jgi:hypothetical protein